MNTTRAVTTVRIIVDGSRFFLKYVSASTTVYVLADGKPKYFTKRGAASTYAAARGWEVDNG